MNISQISDICTGCGSCVAVCPSAAIRMQPDEHGFLHPAVDAAACTNCGLCACKCPVSTPPQVSAHTEILTGYANDENTPACIFFRCDFRCCLRDHPPWRYRVRRGVQSELRRDTYCRREHRGACCALQLQICAEQHSVRHLCAGEGGAYRRTLGLLQRNAVSGGRTKELPRPGV